MREPDFSSPPVIVAGGIAIAAILWGLAQIIPPIFEGLGHLCKAVGAAVGLGFATATTGFATAGVVASWLAPATAAGAATTAVCAAVFVVHKVVERAKEQPYEWLLPALGLLAVFFVDLSKDELLVTGTARALYALATGIFTIGGGLLLLNSRLWVRALGFFLPFLPTGVVWATLVSNGHVTRGLADFILAGSPAAIGMVGVLILGGVIAVLGIALPER